MGRRDPDGLSEELIGNQTMDHKVDVIGARGQ